MGLKTRSQFYYGHEIDKSQHFISIDEGAGELVVNLRPSGYSMTELSIELARALNEAGTLNYAVAVNRASRKFTIEADANFSILAQTGLYAGSNAYSVLGLNQVDKTGADSYESDNATGFVWRPQLPLFDYAPSNLRVGSVQANQDETGSGVVEVVSFGTVNYMDCSAKFITNRCDKPEIVELDIDGVESAMGFLSYIRRKNRIEFMADRENPDVYEKFILSKSAASPQGLEVQLYEMTSMNLQDYYETKTLVFRKVI